MLLPKSCACAFAPNASAARIKKNTRAAVIVLMGEPPLRLRHHPSNEHITRIRHYERGLSALIVVVIVAVVFKLPLRRVVDRPGQPAFEPFLTVVGRERRGRRFDDP